MRAQDEHGEYTVADCGRVQFVPEQFAPEHCLKRAEECLPRRRGRFQAADGYLGAAGVGERRGEGQLAVPAEVVLRSCAFTHA